MLSEWWAIIIENTWVRSSFNSNYSFLHDSTTAPGYIIGVKNSDFSGTRARKRLHSKDCMIASLTWDARIANSRREHASTQNSRQRRERRSTSLALRKKWWCGHKWRWSSDGPWTVKRPFFFCWPRHFSPLHVPLLKNIKNIIASFSIYIRLVFRRIFPTPHLTTELLENLLNITIFLIFLIRVWIVKSPNLCCK